MSASKPVRMASNAAIDEQHERDLAMLERHHPSHTPVKSAGSDRDNRDTSKNEGSAVPDDTGTSRDNMPAHTVIGKTQTAMNAPLPHFLLIEHGNAAYPSGVYHVGLRTEGSEKVVVGHAAPDWLCSPLRVDAMTRDSQNCEWGRLLVFADRDGKEHRWACPQSLHAGNGDDLRRVLLAEGVTITTNPSLRRLIGDYIQRAKPEPRARCVTRTGWHGQAFALPRETIGDTETEPVLFQSANLQGVTLGQVGTLTGWIEQVSTPCAGNSRLVLAVAAGFAAPCLELLTAEGGGIHLRGSSSVGKSTALHVAASMYGIPETYLRTWRATDNGLEGVAAMHSGLLLCLDEIGQLEPKHAGQVAYLLANGQGKSRSNRDGTPRTIATWRLLFLSAGEVGLSELVTQSGGKVRAGQEVRVIDLPADTGASHGLFDALPEGVKAGAFADALKVRSATHAGHALPAFVRALSSNLDKARETLRLLRDSIANDLAPIDASGQVRRVADRFALIAAAGELATGYRLTGWNTGEATAGVSACFRDWLAARGSRGNGEQAAMLAQVRAFLEANGEARFTRWGAPDEGTRTVNRAGFRKPGTDGPIYYVEREAFRNEVCAGFDPSEVARALIAQGALIVGSNNEATRKERLPDGRSVRVYVITPELWEQTQ